MMPARAMLYVKIGIVEEAQVLLNIVSGGRLKGCTLQHCDAISGSLTGMGPLGGTIGGGQSVGASKERLGWPWEAHWRGLNGIHDMWQDVKVTEDLVTQLARTIPPDPLGKPGHVMEEARVFVPL